MFIARGFNPGASASRLFSRRETRLFKGLFAYRRNLRCSFLLLYASTNQLIFFLCNFLWPQKVTKKGLTAETHSGWRLRSNRLRPIWIYGLRFALRSAKFEALGPSLYVNYIMIFNRDIHFTCNKFTYILSNCNCFLDLFIRKINSLIGISDFYCISLKF
jgi:hypothetical protein